MPAHLAAKFSCLRRRGQPRLGVLAGIVRSRGSTLQSLVGLHIGLLRQCTEALPFIFDKGDEFRLGSSLWLDPGGYHAVLGFRRPDDPLQGAVYALHNRFGRSLGTEYTRPVAYFDAWRPLLGRCGDIGNSAHALHPGGRDRLQLSLLDMTEDDGR